MTLKRSPTVAASRRVKEQATLSVPINTIEAMNDLTTQLLHADAEVDCPRCGFPVWLRLSEVIVQGTVLCRCCRLMIRLVDDRGNVATAGDSIQSHMEQVMKETFG